MIAQLLGVDNPHLPVPLKTGELDPVNQELEKLSCEEQHCRTSLYPFKVFITTNESGVQDVASKLSEMKKKVKAVHVGFSGLYNFDLIVHRHSSYGLICDINPDNKRFVDHTLEVVKECDTRSEFMQKILPYIQENQKAFSHFSPTRSFSSLSLEEKVSREGGWLSSDDSYAYIRGLAKAGKIVAITEDITKSETFERVAEVYRQHEIEIDTLYLSNICEFIALKPLEVAFSKTVRYLASPDTIVINCPKNRANFDNSIQQTVSLGEQYLKEGEAVSLFEVIRADHKAGS